MNRYTVPDWSSERTNHLVSSSSSFVQTTRTQQNTYMDLAALTRRKLERMLSTRGQESLRHLVLLNNASTLAQPPPHVQSASDLLQEQEENAMIEHVFDYDDEAFEDEESRVALTRKMEQEWFESTMGGMLETQDMEDEDDADYVEVNFRQSSQQLDDSGFADQKDYTHPKPFSIPKLPVVQEDDDDSSLPAADDVPPLTPDSSPVLSIASSPETELAVIPYYQGLLKTPISISFPNVLQPVSLNQDPTSLFPTSRELRFPLKIPSMDVIDFGHAPKLRATLHRSELDRPLLDEMEEELPLRPFSYSYKPFSSLAFQDSPFQV